MDGSTWIALVEQYVNAINEGAVPDIQSSWAYICRQKAQQALDQSKEAFESEVQDTVQLPMNQTELLTMVNNVKASVIKEFMKQVKGE